MLRQRDMRAVGRMPPKCKTPHFPHPTGLPQSRIWDHGILCQLRYASSQDTDLSVLCRCPLSVALLDRNPPSTLQTDRRTDRRTDVILV